MRTKHKTKRTAAAPSDKLKKEVASLRNHVRRLTDERNQYLRVVHAWAKERISASELQRWMNEIDEEGGSLADLIATLQKKP